MHKELEELICDVRGFRAAMDVIFSSELSEASACRKYFLTLLICLSRLYLRYLSIVDDLPSLEAVSSEFDMSLLKKDVPREALVRQRFKERLQSSSCWSSFAPENAFSQLTNLHTLANYISSFALHLPEIYEETFRVEQYTLNFLENESGAALDYLVIALQHICRNHVNFVHFALEWAAEESSWHNL